MLLAGCKQGAGERCEINSDCKGDLECSVSGVCTAPGGVAPLPDASLSERPRDTATVSPSDGAGGTADVHAPGADSAAPDAAIRDAAVDVTSPGDGAAADHAGDASGG